MVEQHFLKLSLRCSTLYAALCPFEEGIQFFKYSSYTANGMTVFAKSAYRTSISSGRSLSKLIAPTISFFSNIRFVSAPSASLRRMTLALPRPAAMIDFWSP
jgi:hypothetical protein